MKFKKFFLSLLALFLLGSALGFFLFIRAVKNLPDPSTFETRRVAQSTKIYDRSGETLLYEIFGEEKRTIILFADIPDHAKKATIAIEDDGFYSHPAFDWKSIVRALIVNLKHGSIVQGGSTITQQLAKNAFLSPEKTISRKLKELILSFQLEKKYTKDKIFDLYLNQIPYGANAYGIEAAAQTYFNKSAKNLTLAEAALLASLPKAPSYYSPHGAHLKELLERKNLVLEKMLNLSFITRQEKEKAQKEELKFAPPIQDLKAPHFVITVQDYLLNRYGEDFVRTAGLKVTTTLNWPLQELAEKVVSEGAQKNSELYQGKNAALVAQDTQTGQILALVGSQDYFNIENEGNFNVATQGLRQPGSAIKPFAYLAAFKKGYTPETIVFDLETEFDNSGRPEKSYQPQNFDQQFRGPVTLRQGLAQSINVPSVKTLYLAGLSETIDLAHDFGITTLNEKNRYGLSLALGGGEVKLIDLTGAYSVFSQDGIKHNQSFILKIEDQNNKIIEEYKDKNTRVIDAQFVRLINDILSDKEARRPLFQNSLNLTTFPNQEIALKTGTTNDYRDAWTIGYTPSLVVGVWAGNNNNQPMQKKAGSILAAIPIWHNFIKEVLKNRPPETFPRPESINNTKPILNGQYLINNQIHDILFYVNKNNPQGPVPTNPTSDPQFENWEKPILEWIRNNPEKIKTIIPATGLTIEIQSPQNGSFVSNPLILLTKLESFSGDIQKIEIYFNNSLVEQKIDNFGKSIFYQTAINPVLELQNNLKMKIYDSANNYFEKEIIVFQKI